jgi:hypothetical protein
MPSGRNVTLKVAERHRRTFPVVSGSESASKPPKIARMPDTMTKSEVQAAPDA